jgi:hypothetical protein
MANGGLRINKKLADRHSPGYMARRAAKRQDRATFRQKAQRGFGELSNGLRVIDYAVVGVYEEFTGFRSWQMAVDIVLVAVTLCLLGLPTNLVIGAGVTAFAALVTHGVILRRRASKAKEAAYIAALKNAQSQQPPAAPEGV